MDIVRVLRVIEFVGRRDDVEKQLAASLQNGTVKPGAVTFNVATVGSFPEIIGEEPDEPTEHPG